MPFTVNDVDKHKSGLSPKQKKQWVAIANSVLKKCMDEPKGTDKKCAPKAIKQASGSVKELKMTDEQENVEAGLSTETKETSREKGYVPYGVTTWEELDAARDAQELANEAFDTANDFIWLVEHTTSKTEITDKGTAVLALAAGFASRMKESTSKEVEEIETEVKESVADHLMQRISNTVTGAIKSVFGLDKKEEVSEQTLTDKQSFMVWKEKDGSMRWFARYSNNFRDEDNVPEIIAEESHRRFTDLVDNKEAKMPELWLWHVPQWKWGEAEWVAYDDSGFALAMGAVDKGCEPIAEWLGKQKNVLVSHGMPSSSIKRDPNDSSIIVEHISEEISPLPAYAAANKMTDFIVLEEINVKEDSMSIPQDKLDFLVSNWNLDPALLDSLQARNSQDAEKAKGEGKEFKEKEIETKTDDAETEEVPEVTATETETTETETETAPQDQSPTRQEVADAFAAVVAPIVERTELLESQLEEARKEISELKLADVEKIEKAVHDSSPATVSALLAERLSAIGNANTQVDGRSKLGRSRPKETQSDTHPRSIIPFVNKMLEESDQAALNS